MCKEEHGLKTDKDRYYIDQRMCMGQQTSDVSEGL